MNGLINTLLRISGLPQESIDKISAASPAAAALVTLVKDNEPLIRDVGAFYIEAKPAIDKAVALYAQAKPLIDRATPLVPKAWADIEAILPAAEDVLNFLQKQSAPIVSAQDMQVPSGDLA